MKIPDPYQLRVLQEQADLDERIEKLITFLDISPKYEKLPVDEKRRLTQQLEAMHLYNTALKERIAAW